jgi:hypothetical protein
MQPAWTWSAWTWFWLAYALIGIVAECIGLFNKLPGDTLSEQIWALRDRIGGSGWWSLGMFIGAAFFAWLLWHFGWEGRPEP